MGSDRAWVMEKERTRLVKEICSAVGRRLSLLVVTVVVVAVLLFKGGG